MNTKLGTIASLAGILVALAFLDQIRLNLSGQIGSIIFPTMSIFNSLAWMSYGYCRREKDWALIICNGFGFLMAFLTILSALIHK